MDFIHEARKHQDQIVKDLVGLIKIPSLTDPATAKPGAPFGHALRQALDYTLELGQRDGFKTRDLEG